MKADIETLMAPVRDHDNLKREGFATSVEVSEGVDLLHITLQV